MIKITFLKNLNSFLQKRMYLVVLTGIICGLLFSPWLFSGKPAVPWVFAFMTLTLALGTGFKDLKGVLQFPLPLLLTLFCLHGISPLFSYTLGKICYGSDSLLTAGLVLTAAIPVGVTSVIWVGLAGGHIPLALTNVTVDSLLSPIMVPLIVSLFLGEAVTFDAQDMFYGLFQMIVLPTLLGVAIHDLGGDKITKMDRWWLNLLSKLGLSFVVGVNVATSKEYLYTAGPRILTLFFVLLIMISFNFALGYVAARFAKYPRNLVRTLLFQVGLRNISAGIVIASNYFPPAAALPCVVALLIQQPTASIIMHFLEKPSATAGIAKEN